MNLSKKIKEINIEGKDYILCFDMKSILVYKELSSKTFTKGIEGLLMLDDEEAIYFIASMLRHKEEPNKPLAEEVVNGNVLEFLTNFKYLAIEVVMESLPSDESVSKKK